MINIKKIASGIASVLMLGSTVALGAATSYPQPFNGGDVVIVTGSWPGASDAAAALTIVNHLSPLVGGTGGSSNPTGDTLKLEKGSNFFNLGEQMDDFYSTIDDDRLPIALANGEYISDDNEDYDYEQSVVLGANTLTHFQDGDFNDDKPIMGFDLASGATIMNYTIDFSPDNVICGAAAVNCKTTELPLMGKNYFVSDATQTSNGWKITLLDSAVERTLTEGETVTVPLNGVNYDIVNTFMDNTYVGFTVDGVSTGKLQAGNTKKVGSGEAYIGIKEINDVSGYESPGNVIFSLGSGKIVLENGEEVVLNEDTVSDLTDKHVVKSYITNATSGTGGWDSITLEWTLQDDVWIVPGTPLEYPIFDTFALSFDGLNFPLEEVTSLDTNGDDSITLDAVIKEGPVSFDVLYTGNATTFDTYTGIGEKSTHKLATSGVEGGTTAATAVTLTLNETENTYFVATWVGTDSAESYVYEIGTISNADGKNETTLINQVTGGKDITFTGVGDTDTVGEVDFLLAAANKNNKVATINFTAGSSGNVYSNKIVTKEGLQIRLPVSQVNAAAGDGNIFFGNATVSTTAQTWKMNFTEEDDDDNIAAGESFTVTLGFDSDDGADISATSVTDYETADGTDKYIGYVNGPLATQTMFNDPSGGLGDIEVTYHGGEVKGDVFLSQGVSGDGDTTVLSITDDKVAVDGVGKHLIVVGGTCVNQEAARLLGSTDKLCGTAWTTKTGAAANEYIIQTFSRTGGKIATLVAGYEAADTRNAATYLTTKPVLTEVGKKYKGTESDSATLVS